MSFSSLQSMSVARNVGDVQVAEKFPSKDSKLVVGCQAGSRASQVCRNAIGIQKAGTKDTASFWPLHCCVLIQT